METNEQKKRGFAAMDPEKQRELASRGGKNAHAKGTAHKFTVEAAKKAGTKGGSVISANSEHMRQIGRKGGAKNAEKPGHMAKLGRLGVEARQRRAAEERVAGGD